MIFLETGRRKEIEDFSGVNMQIPRKYDFNKAKRLFIKEPWVVFCIDSNEAYFDFTKDSIRKEFFERLDYTVYGNYLSWAKKDFPTVYWFLVNVMGYNDSDQFSVVQRYDTEKMYVSEVKKLTRITTSIIMCLYLTILQTL